ncbi:MAG: terminase large subunit domain-containing protein, partial [Alphaproteobacteria bacterium]
MSAEERTRLLDSLTEDEAAVLEHDWQFWARDEQLPPQGDWRIWLFMGGRGSGKTRAGAEWVLEGVRSGRLRRVALVGATYADARAVMVEGDSGLLPLSQGAAEFEPSKRELHWPGGCMAQLFTAEEPDGLRGPQFDAAWCDEFAKWREPAKAFDMLMMGLRLGENPRCVVTTTPRAVPAFLDLVTRPGVAVTRATTYDNAANLAPAFLAHMRAQYAGTRLGRQELDAEILEDNENALWKRDWIERARVCAAPALEDLARIIVAVDPPAGAGPDADECGIVVVG